jgi:hypothetical protein
MAPAPVLPAVPPPLPTSASVSFRNARAVWITLLVAVVTLIAMFAVAIIFQPLVPVILCAAGFVAVRFYRQPGTPLNAAGAARLGWMTGLWLFLAFALMFAMAALLIANHDTWEQVKTMWARLPQATPLLSLSQHDALMQLLTALPFSFFILTLLPGLGGILGAKFPRRRSS